MIGPLDNLEKERLGVLPEINRAREFRLYGRDGSRWLDCWLDDGRALLGHRPEGLSLRLKNTLSQGLYAPYPSRWDSRLKKALKTAFPEFPGLRLYQNPQTAGELLGLPAPADPLESPAAEISWGRLYLSPAPETRILFPLLPLPGFNQAQAVLFRDPSPSAPPSDPLSPLIKSAMTLAAFAWVQAEKKLQEQGDLWKNPPGDWERKGPYLLFKGALEDYGKIFEDYARRKVLLAPSPRRPVILPLVWSSYEEKLFGGRKRSSS